MFQNSTPKTPAFRHLRQQIAANVSTLRREKRLTLAMLSARTGVSVNRLDRFELGYGELNLLCLFHIATALEVDVQRLFVAPA